MEFSLVSIGLEFLSEYKYEAQFLRLRLKMHACRLFMMQWMTLFVTILLLADQNRSLQLHIKFVCHLVGLNLRSTAINPNRIVFFFVGFLFPIFMLYLECFKR